MNVRFAIITHLVHKKNKDGQIGGYAPYIREMNLWLKYVDKLIIVGPVVNEEFGPIDIPYQHSNIDFIKIPQFEITSKREMVSTLFKLPLIVSSIFKGMRRSNHIHLRCPGNVGLVGSMIQIFFPTKKKTAKYAGNWDWNSKQPWSYRLQQRILRNTFLTKNMQVLVYGNWPDQNKNLKPFFTATYHENEKIEISLKPLNDEVKLIYIGVLSKGKQPIKSAEVCKDLIEKGVNVHLDYFGEGNERESLLEYIIQNKLQDNITLHGNVSKSQLIEALKESHFLVFISKSEGWPKAVAESMFWATLPLTTRVSCVPEMVDHGNRGDIVEADVNSISDRIIHYMNSPEEYTKKCIAAMEWSRQFTLEKFESEIEKLI